MGNHTDAPLQTSAQTPSPNSPAANGVSLTMPLRDLSQEKRELWVERIFSRMSAMYGRLFADMWAGSDLPEVKVAWTDDLGAFCGQQIAWAMEQCKSRELPPTLPAFRNLCQQAPRPEVPALPAPRVPQEVAQQRARELRKQAERVAARRIDGLAWAKSPPASGVRGSLWERQIIDLAEAGDVRVLEILVGHVERGVIRCERAQTVLAAAFGDVAA